jgi:transcriptional regulator GlxA family with amidase domain
VFVPARPPFGPSPEADMTYPALTAVELREIVGTFPPRTLGGLALPGFQALDLWGPLEMFGNCAPAISPLLVGRRLEPIPCAQGPRVFPDVTLVDAPHLDLLLIPGGLVDTHREDRLVVEWIRSAAADAEVVMSVCNGADLLAETGLLEGRRATTNKALFRSIAARHPGVDWVPHARWVEDGRFVTSSGVSAGIDMALSVIARLAGERVADGLAVLTEYDRHPASGWDPFAVVHGLGAAD